MQRLAPASVSFIHGFGCRSLRALLAPALALVLVFVTPRAFAQEPSASTVDLPPASAAALEPGPDLPPLGTRSALVVTGAAVFVGWYGAAVGQSFLWPDAPAAEKLRIPVAGPWMMIAKTGCDANETDCSDAVAIIRSIIAGISAIGQVGGLAAMAEGAFLRTDDTVRTKPVKPNAFRAVSVTAGGDRIGVGVIGEF